MGLANLTLLVNKLQETLGIPEFPDPQVFLP